MASFTNLKLRALVLFVFAVVVGAAWGQSTFPMDANTPPGKAPALESAPVIVDGRLLFRVVGTQAYPAAKRATEIGERIVTLAEDGETPVETLRLQEEKGESLIVTGDTLIARVLEPDARLLGLERPILAQAFLERIREAVKTYRHERTAETLRSNTLSTVLATGILMLFVTAAFLGRRKLLSVIERRSRATRESVNSETIGEVAAGQLWQFANGALNILWAIILLASAYIYINYALYTFPSTRSVAQWLLELILGPLRLMADAVVTALPDLVYIAILFLLVRYLLELIFLVFLGVGRGSIRWAGFEREWAIPTYKLVRAGIIAFALVIAYPRIPGSDSDAFKGISVFIGVLFSIGASNMVSNILAGYVILYRLAFRVGDRVTIGEHTGDVVDIRQQITVLRTPKNEDVHIPNSEILSASIVNYSSMGRRKRLVLHTSVTIGYDTPWRQVEAMLLTAASRTQGLLDNPPPFVLKAALEDFYVRYEINAYCDDASRMLERYSQLHQNILDVCNESCVQIMSPHFVAQPAEAVIARPDGGGHAPTGLGVEGGPAQSTL